MSGTLCNSRSSLTASLVFVAAGLLVSGFGTIQAGGQDSEHERITRHALGCQASAPIENCFQGDTIDNLAGSTGNFGAVGAPDRGRGLLNYSAHCDGGDHLDVEGYPQSRAEAQASLRACRDYMQDNLSHAVEDAADLLDSEGNIRSSQIPDIISCTYAGNQHGRAKCDVLGHLGRVMHASQDFYSHSNWVDIADTSRPVGADNPPGLENRGRAAWLDLRITDPAFPNGLISGCFDSASYLGEQRGCLYDDGNSHRVRHFNLNKDTGTIDPAIGMGTTERGAIGDNFERAVVAAIDDTSDKWTTFRERLVEAYGVARAQTMICAITHDNPSDDCT